MIPREVEALITRYGHECECHGAGAGMRAELLAYRAALVAAIERAIEQARNERRLPLVTIAHRRPHHD